MQRDLRGFFYRTLQGFLDTHAIGPECLEVAYQSGTDQIKINGSLFVTCEIRPNETNHGLEAVATFEQDHPLFPYAMRHFQGS